MHVNLGGYHISDIEFTAAFDVTTDKVGKDLADAIWAHPNDTIKFADVPKTGITVNRGMTHDGLGKYISEVVTKAPGETDDIVGILRETKTDVVVSYLPVGSEAAAKWYAEQCLEAGVALVNCMPVFIAREGYWQKRFEEKGLPIIGDDIKSQVGATITHRVLTSLFRERGVHLDRTMQLNVGGNSDFLNMLERTRLESKKISKTNAVTSMLDYDMGEGNVHVGPSDYVPWLTDRKWAFIRMEGTSFGDVPLNIELKLEVWDSPNSAGIVIDAVRMAKLALNNGDRRRARGPVELPDEVAAGADRRRRGVRGDGEVHRPERAQEDEGFRPRRRAPAVGSGAMGSVALEPASTLSPAQLADLFTAGYEGYYLPFSIDEAGFRFMAGTWDFDLEASRVAAGDGVPVGICNLGVRGEEGWIGGVGVVASRRGEGIGEQLMRAVQSEARARGLKRIWLEVLIQNEPAIRLYEKLGYQRVRELEVWSLAELVLQEHKVRTVDVAAAQKRIRAARESGSRGSVRTRRSRTSRTSRRSRAIGPLRCSAAPASGLRCSRRSPTTRAPQASSCRRSREE